MPPGLGGSCTIHLLYNSFIVRLIDVVLDRFGRCSILYPASGVTLPERAYCYDSHECNVHFPLRVFLHCFIDQRFLEIVLSKPFFTSTTALPIVFRCQHSN